MAENPAVEEALAEALIDEVKATRGAKSPVISRDLADSLSIGSDKKSRMSGASTDDPDRDESYVTVYSTLNGAPSTILVAMLPKVIRKRIAKENWYPQEMWGKLAFSLAPVEEPKRQNHMCMLHTDHAMREQLDAMGLVGMTCPKDNIPNVVEVRRHMQHRHKSTWEVIEETRKEGLEAADRKAQRDQTDAIKALAERMVENGEK